LVLSLKTIFVAGELCDYETKAWAEKIFKVPILNNWWQSETGHPITALCLGYGHHASLPKFSTGLPIPGYDSEYLLISFFLNFYICKSYLLYHTQLFDLFQFITKQFFFAFNISDNL